MVGGFQHSHSSRTGFSSLTVNTHLPPPWTQSTLSTEETLDRVSCAYRSPKDTGPCSTAALQCGEGELKAAKMGHLAWKRFPWDL